MTDTERFIRQAAREVGISLDQEIDIIPGPGLYEVKFKNRRGDAQTVEIAMAAEFKAIHDRLKAAWKGKLNS